MPLEKATAIVIRVVSWSESSSIVTLFTREMGKVRAVAKGARRPKGPFESALDVLALCRIVFARKSSDALDLLTEAKLLRRFRPARQNLSCLYAGYYVAELLSELTDDYDSHPLLFDAAEETLCALSRGDPGAVLTLRFELAALRLLGHLPSLEQCAECGAEVEGGGRIAFGQLDGGVLCTRCRPGKRQVVSLSGGAWELMRRLARDDESWQEQEIALRSVGEVRGVMNNHIAHLLGRKPRMHNYLTSSDVK